MSVNTLETLAAVWAARITGDESETELGSLAECVCAHGHLLGECVKCLPAHLLCAFREAIRIGAPEPRDAPAAPAPEDGGAAGLTIPDSLVPSLPRVPGLREELDRMALQGSRDLDPRTSAIVRRWAERLRPWAGPDTYEARCARLQGDAALVHLPEGKWMLVDGGGNDFDVGHLLQALHMRFGDPPGANDAEF